MKFLSYNSVYNVSFVFIGIFTASFNGNGGSGGSGGSSTSYGTFTQSITAPTSTQLIISITVSGCLNTDSIYCQVKIFQNSEPASALGLYESWGTCASGSVSLTQSDSIDCTPGYAVSAPIFCVDTTFNKMLDGDPNSDINVTCT